MADFIMEDIEIEEDQEYVITDPDLYVNRFNKAIEEQRFDDALFEAEKSIEYSNDAKEYQIFKLQALFASGRYQDTRLCFPRPSRGECRPCRSGRKCPPAGYPRCRRTIFRHTRRAAAQAPHYSACKAHRRYRRFCPLSVLFLT